MMKLSWIWGRKRIEKSYVKIILSFIVVIYLAVNLISNRNPQLEFHSRHLQLSSQLPNRLPWKYDQHCKAFNISYLSPHTGERIALASYPGSGSTWVRYLIECASGVFTGSVYKDLELQLKGYWGEIRDWRDGTTIVQKTHDSGPELIRNEFHGRGILIMRNPYDAVLSKFNYLYGGHHGTAATNHFDRPDWDKFVEIEIKDWLLMAVNWIQTGSPDTLHVLHYENVKSDLRGEIKNLLLFLGIIPDDKRINCLLKQASGSFQRASLNGLDKKLPFRKQMRMKIDQVIAEVNKLFVRRGYQMMPLELYKSYNKSDTEISNYYRGLSKSRRVNAENKEDEKEDSVSTLTGTKMIISQFVRFYSKEKEETDSFLNKMEKMNLSDDSQVPKFLNFAVKMWPNIERGLKTDPLTEVIQTKGNSSESLSSLINSFQAKYSEN